MAVRPTKGQRGHGKTHEGAARGAEKPIKGLQDPRRGDKRGHGKTQEGAAREAVRGAVKPTKGRQ